VLLFQQRAAHVCCNAKVAGQAEAGWRVFDCDYVNGMLAADEVE
jgi:hypothetical protein